MNLRLSHRPILLVSTVLAFGLGLMGAPNSSSALYQEELIIEGGGGGGGGGSGGSGGTSGVLGSASDFMSYGQGQYARPSGELATVYIHGYGGGLSFGTGPWGGVSVGLNPRYIAWESWNSPNTSRNQTAFKNNLDTWCAGSTKPCEIVSHSFGSLAIGLLIAQNPGRWNILKVTSIQGAHGGTNIAAIAASLQPAMRALIWCADRVGIKVPLELRNMASGSGLTDLIPTVARGLYNHDTSTPWKTVGTKFIIPKKKCKWYQVGCHIVNFGIGIARGVIKNIHGGNNDLVVPLASAASSRYSSNSGTAPCNLTRWTGHSHIVSFHGSSGCTVGPNIPHSSVYLLRSSDINGGMYVAAIDQSMGGTQADCTLSEDACNSENTSGTTTYYKPDAAYFRSMYGYQNYLDSAEVDAYVAAGGGTLGSNYLPYSESTSSTSSSGGGGGGGGGGSGSNYY